MDRNDKRSDSPNTMMDLTERRDHWKRRMKLAIVVTITSYLIQSIGLQTIGYSREFPLEEVFAGLGVVGFLAVCYYWYRLRRTL